ncbi:MAG TPA: transcription termination factor NusA [Anaerolineaceae bacterium]|nr:transcription termination factor NusA [Anaerolineaceae bacterium]
MRNEFTLAFNEVLEEKGLPREIIIKALESAMVSAYRRSVNASTAQIIDAKVDMETGKVTIFAEKEVVEEVQDERTEVTLEEARKYDNETELGMMVSVESTPKNFGRVAAQTARQVIQQRIRDAERQAQLDHYADQIGEIISGVVQASNAQGLTIGLEMKAEGTMLRKDMIPGERFHVHDRVRTLVSEVKDSNRGPQILLSRTHRNFLRRLLETEVPEIYHGIVEIRSITREPGQRAKVAVSATQSGIDPVGACVGLRGVRIQAIVRELHDEKIDVIEWHQDPAHFISRAVSPAKVSGVYLNEYAEGGKTATVVVPEDQLSLAIGRDGQNARLAAKLTGWRIDIKSVQEASSDALYRLQKDPAMAEMIDIEKENMVKVEELLAKKTAGGILNMDSYDFLNKFVERVETRTFIRSKEEEEAEKNKLKALQAQIPPSYFDATILDSGLPEHVNYILQEAGYNTIAELVIKMLQIPDDILRLNGIGPKAMNSIQSLMDSLPEVLATELEQSKVEPEEIVEEQSETEIPDVEEKVLDISDESVEEEDDKQELPEIVEVKDIEPIDEVESVIIEEVEKETIDKTPEEKEPVTPEEELSFDELFALQSTNIDIPFVEEDEDEDISDKKAAKKKDKKKKRHVKVEYDDEEDVLIYRKIHKREDGLDWE